MRIGQYLKRQDWRDPDVASDRIRGEWIMKYCPQMQEWRPDQEYDAVIFHNPVWQIAKTKGIKILDICDPMWKEDPAQFKSIAAGVDGIVTATDQLHLQVLGLVQKPILTIGDGHYFPFYETRAWNAHLERARTAVWFGYADNAFCLKPLFPALFSNGIWKLKVIAERNPCDLVTGVEFVKWKLETFVHEISQADFALLPMTQSYKSNNKDISALLSGIPVAKTADDISRLVDPVERQRAMVAAADIVSKHCARDRASQYREFISFLSSERGG